MSIIWNKTTLCLILLIWQVHTIATDDKTVDQFDKAVTRTSENDQSSRDIRSNTELSTEPKLNKTTNKDGFTFLISGGHREPDKMKYASYMVSIRSRQPARYFGDNHFCAGSIIGPSLILTAAHCVMDKRKVLTRPRRLLIVAGSPNRLQIDSTTIQYPVESVISHPKFIRNNTDDIALIRIKGTFPTDNVAIKTIKLASALPPFGKNCTTIGWGRLYYNGPLSALTTHVSVLLYTPEQCYAKTSKFKAGMLCAGDNVLYNEDPCRGDSGGPLICNDELTGIVSWTIGCGSKSFPSIYTDVFYHMDWIMQNMNNAPMHRISSLMFALLVLTLVLF